jgi:hypothetical protein
MIIISGTTNYAYSCFLFKFETIQVGGGSTRLKVYTINEYRMEHRVIKGL